MTRKSKFFPVFVIAAVILGIAAFGYFQSVPNSKEENNSPKIEIQPKVFDFGQAKYGDVLRHKFKIKNSGNRVLEIKRVATSCGCTSAKVSKEKINPGETAELLVTYDTGAMGSGPHGKGKQERIIYIKSNDPASPQVEVMIYAYVR